MTRRSLISAAMLLAALSPPALRMQTLRADQRAAANSAGAATAAVRPAASEAGQSVLGRTIGEFALNDFRRKTHRLSDFDDCAALVVAFVGTECPLAKLYAPRLAALSDAYKPRGVGFLAINSNQQDALTELEAYARRHGIEFPVLKDLGNRVADRFGAERTPEVFVLDRKRAVRYRGRIDNQYGIGYARQSATETYLCDAVDAVLQGEPVKQPEVAAVGCHIGRLRTPDPNAEVTYSNQIARLFQRRCVECHRPGEIAPFALTTYDEVVGWADMIAEVVRQNRMPPWHASPEHGRFSNDRRLSSDEQSLVYRWVSAGAPEGDPAELPEPIEYTDRWQLPQTPDLVVPMAEKPFVVPAEGAVRYQYFTVDPGFTEDKFVEMVEAVPGNRVVVHHILVMAKPPGRRGGGIGTGDFLAAYVPGLRARPFPEGMAKRIPAGSKLVFQMHYTPVGSVQEDLSKVGFVFAEREELEHLIITTKSVNRGFEIPPHARDHVVTAQSKRAPRDMLLLSMMPHMHVRGKAFRYEAVWPNGSTETLLNVPAYDFNWQTVYRLAEPLPLRKGTSIRCEARYDNSAHNLANPDPTKAVGWGDQTWNEMMIGYFDIAVPIQ